MAKRGNANGSPGPAADARGRSGYDPTDNVIALNEASNKRADDLRDLTLVLINARLDHLKETGEMRARHTREMRKAEAGRVDAIRAVDVGAAEQLRRDTAQQAATLAQQVATSAETLRTQVAATALAARSELNAALAPMQKDISEVRQAMFEAQGQKTQVVEQRSAAEDWKPVLDKIDSLMLTQSLNQGGRAQVVEQRAATASTVGIIGLALALGLAAVGYFATREPAAPVVIEVPAVQEAP